MENSTEKGFKLPGKYVKFDKPIVPEKRIEYILASKDTVMRPFLFKIKDSNEYLVFKGLCTCELKTEESYDKITNGNIIRYLIQEHNETLYKIATQNVIRYTIDSGRALEWSNLVY